MTGFIHYTDYQDKDGYWYSSCGLLTNKITRNTKIVDCPACKRYIKRIEHSISLSSTNN